MVEFVPQESAHDPEEEAAGHEGAGPATKQDLGNQGGRVADRDDGRSRLRRAFLLSPDVDRFQRDEWQEEGETLDGIVCAPSRIVTRLAEPGADEDRPAQPLRRRRSAQQDRVGRADDRTVQDGSPGPSGGRREEPFDRPGVPGEPRVILARRRRLSRLAPPVHLDPHQLPEELGALGPVAGQAVLDPGSLPDTTLEYVRPPGPIERRGDLVDPGLGALGTIAHGVASEGRSYSVRSPPASPRLRIRFNFRSTLRSKLPWQSAFRPFRDARRPGPRANGKRSPLAFHGCGELARIARAREGERLPGRSDLRFRHRRHVQS